MSTVAPFKNVGIHVTFVLLCFNCLHAQAITPGPANAEGREPSQTQNAEKKSAADAENASKNAAIIYLLRSLAREAQMFDSRLRFHVQAHIANLLWIEDRSFARDLFLKAWESAEHADRDFDDHMTDDRHDPAQTSALTSYAPQSRREVIFLATQNDPTLGEELLARMAKGYAQSEHLEAGSANNALDTAERNKPSPAELDRLATARQLLENGETEQATQFAGEALNRFAASTLTFLSQLREKDPTAADQFYVSLLSRAVDAPWADANTVSLLSSYVFSPGLYLTFSRSGFPSLVQTNNLNTHVNISPSTRSAFLGASARILLRPPYQSREPEDLVSRRISYMVIARLLPVFEQFDPNTAVQLRFRLNQLEAVVPTNLKSPSNLSKVRSGIDYGDSKHDIQELLGQAKRLANSTERDRIYVRAAVAAAERGETNVQATVEEISSAELRSQVRAYVYLALAKHALENKNVDKALELARLDEMTPIHRVWIYTEAARLIGIRRADLATKVLLESVPIARRISENDPDSARAMVAIATQFMKVNRARAADYVTEAIEAANRVDSFSGENTTIVMTLESSIGDWSMSYNSQNFALKSLFFELARDDFFQAINIAKNLVHEEPKSVALMAIAQSALTKKREQPRLPATN